MKHIASSLVALSFLVCLFNFAIVSSNASSPDVLPAPSISTSFLPLSLEGTLPSTITLTSKECTAPPLTSFANAPVFALHAGGRGTAFSGVRFGKRRPIPDAPVPTVVYGDHNETAHVTWPEVANIGSGGYVLQQFNGGAWGSVGGGTAPHASYDVSLSSPPYLINGEDRQFRLWAQNSSGSSAYVYFTVHVDLQAPGVSARYTGSGWILEWAPVPNARGYDIYKSTDGYNFTFDSGTTFNFKNAGNPTQTTYYFVVAYNRAGVGYFGEGAASRIVSTSPTPDDPTRPGPPQPSDACPEGCGSYPDPVDLTTGDERMVHDPDLTVYNPSGPSGVFQRSYYSNQSQRNYGSPGLPEGWVHNFDVTIDTTYYAGLVVYPVYGGSAQTVPIDNRRVLFPNGSRDAIAPGSLASPGVYNWTVPAGSPYRLQKFTSPDKMVMTWKDGTLWEFTPHNTTLYRLTKITNPLGQVITLDWDAGRRLLAVRDGSGTALLTCAYNTSGIGDSLLASVTDRYSRKVTYTIGTTPNGKNLTEVSQIVSSSTSSPPMRWQYTYEAGLATVAVPSFASTWGSSFRASTRAIERLKTKVIPSPTGTGTSTASLEWDSQNRVTALVDANANRKEFTYNPPSFQTTVTTKEPGGAVALVYTQKYDNERRDTGAIDAGSNQTYIYYDDTNNKYKPTRVKDASARQWTYTYDTDANLLTKTTPRGVVTTYTYDRTYNPMGRLATVTEGSKASTIITYYEPSGLVNTVTSPKPGGGGTVTNSYTYDALGNLLTATTPGNNAASTITTTLNYTNDPAFVQSAKIKQPLVVTDALGHATHLRYDTMGRVVQTWDALGNTTDIAYNLSGQVTDTYLPATGQTGAGRTHTVNNYQFDGGPLVQSLLYNEVLPTPVLVRTTTYTYGLEGETLSRTGTPEAFAKTYDALYRIKTLMDANGNSTSYTYNNRGLLSQVSYPGGDTLQYSSYDATGRLLQRIDGNAAVTNYTYSDPDGQLTNIAYPAATTNNVTLTYDGYGRLASEANGTGNKTFTYGDLDELQSVATTYTGLSAKTISYGYYPDGNRSSMTTPAGSFSYNYDAAGRPLNLTNPFGETTAWTWKANNWADSQTYANGIVTTYTQNAAGQLQELANKYGATVLSAFTVPTTGGYDGAGNRLSATANVPSIANLPGTTSWTYNTLDRVTGETSTKNGGWTESYAYDNAGNPTTFRGNTRTYNNKNQVTGGSDIPVAITYDGNGNRLKISSYNLQYDTENRWTKFLTTGGAPFVSFGYTPDNLRAWKEKDYRTYFLYDGAFAVVELDATGAVSATNTFGAMGLISRNTPSSGVHTNRFYTFDERGNVTQRFDENRVLRQSYVTSAFGDTIRFPSSSPNEPFTFAAQSGSQTDPETGIVYCVNRYYDRSTGQWLTRDPIGYEGGINLYAYVQNNPIMGIDPSGLIIVDTNPNSKVNKQIRAYRQKLWKNYRDSGMDKYDEEMDNRLWKDIDTWGQGEQYIGGIGMGANLCKNPGYQAGVNSRFGNRNGIVQEVTQGIALGGTIVRFIVFVRNVLKDHEWGPYDPNRPTPYFWQQ